MLATRARKWDQAIKRGTGNEPSTYAQWSLFNCKEKQNYDACKKMYESGQYWYNTKWGVYSLLHVSPNF